MRTNRKPDQIRRPKITVDFCPSAYGSVLFEMEHTRVICAATVNKEVPEHAVQKGTGGITAEYSLLPYSTNPRSKRPLITRDGRAVEIQRLISRSLRGIVDLGAMQGICIQVDCDVLEADGGTRTAAVTGGYIALNRAVQRLLREGALERNPIKANVAAISVGYVNRELLVDLDFSEDSKADVDLNVIMDGKGNLIEVQGTGERSTFTVQQLNDMIERARACVFELITLQNAV